MRCTLWCQNVSSQTCRVFVFRCCLVYTLKVVFERNVKKKNTRVRTNRFVCVCVSSNGKRPPVQKKRRGRRRENASMLKLNADIYEWFRTTDESFYKRFIISNSVCATLLQNISNVGGTGFSLRNRFFFFHNERLCMRFYHLFRRTQREKRIGGPLPTRTGGPPPFDRESR